MLQISIPKDTHSILLGIQYFGNLCNHLWVVHSFDFQVWQLSAIHIKEKCRLAAPHILLCSFQCARFTRVELQPFVSIVKKQPFAHLFQRLAWATPILVNFKNCTNTSAWVALTHRARWLWEWNTSAILKAGKLGQAASSHTCSTGQRWNHRNPPKYYSNCHSDLCMNVQSMQVFGAGDFSSQCSDTVIDTEESTL